MCRGRVVRIDFCVERLALYGSMALDGEVQATEFKRLPKGLLK